MKGPAIQIDVQGILRLILPLLLAIPAASALPLGSSAPTCCDTVIPVHVVLEQQTVGDMNVLFIRDTAYTTEAMSGIFGRDYGELMGAIQAGHLQARRFMAWHDATQAPWPMEVAVETDRLPVGSPGRIRSRIEPGGAMVVAHVTGPYDQVGQAYERIESWLRENSRKKRGRAYEVYVNDPSSVRSPAELRTDVCQPIE